MNKSNEHVTHARGLRADIMAAPDVWLPRREVLVDWLDGFLRRAEARTYEIRETEATDLAALEQFLRRKKVPIAA
jgi:hypothetical protein